MRSGIGPAPANYCRTMKALLRLIPLWTALAALWWLLARMGDDDLPEWLSITGWSLLLPLAVWLTAWAVAVWPRTAALRLLFWTVVGAGWLAVFLVAQAG